MGSGPQQWLHLLPGCCPFSKSRLCSLLHLLFVRLKEIEAVWTSSQSRGENKLKYGKLALESSLEPKANDLAGFSKRWLSIQRLSASSRMALGSQWMPRLIAGGGAIAISRALEVVSEMAFPARCGRGDACSKWNTWHGVLDVCLPSADSADPLEACAWHFATAFQRAMLTDGRGQQHRLLSAELGQALLGGIGGFIEEPPVQAQR